MLGIERAVDRPHLVAAVGILMVVLGLFSAATIPIELTPPVRVPVVVVAVPYPGAAPEEVETNVGLPLERTLMAVDDVDFVASACGEGVFVATVQFFDEADLDDALRDARDAADSAKAEFPNEADEPLVFDIEFEDLPIVYVNLSGIDDPARLKRIAEDVRDEIERVPGISGVDIYGGRDAEVHVRADPELLRYHGLGFRAIAAALASHNVSFPGGDLEVGTRRFVVRTSGRFRDIEEIERIPVGRSAAGVLYLRDVAEVSLGSEEARSYSRLNGESALTLLIRRKSGINTLATIRRIKDRLAELCHTGAIPPEVRLTYTHDMTVYIWQMVRQLGQSAVIGMAIVVGILYLAMGFRSALLVASAIPLSLLFALAIMRGSGMVISNIAIFSMILILGMVVDGAIIVGENIYRHYELGETGLEPARQGLREVGGAVISADLTTISAFVPMFFMVGIMGQFLSVMPRIVAYALTGSIIVDHLILPALAARIMDPSRKKAWRPGPVAMALANPFLLGAAAGLFGLAGMAYIVRGLGAAGPLPPRADVFELAAHVIWAPGGARGSAFLVIGAGLAACALRGPLGRTAERARRAVLALIEWTRVRERYALLLAASLENRGKVLAVAFLGAAVAVGVISSGRLGTEFFPKVDAAQMRLHFAAEPGTRIEESLRISGQVERAALAVIDPAELENYVSSVGEGDSNLFTAMRGGGASGPETGAIQIELVDLHERPGRRDVWEIWHEIEKRIDGRFAGVEFGMAAQVHGPPTTVAIEVRIKGSNLDVLHEVSKLVESRLHADPDAIDINNSFQRGRSEVRVEPSRAAAAVQGLSASMIAADVMTAFHGTTATEIILGDEEVDVRLMSTDRRRASVRDVAMLPIETPFGHQVPLEMVADVIRDEALTTITRRDGHRTVSVTCDIAPTGNVEASRKAIEKAMAAERLPPGVSLEYGGENEEQERSMQSLREAFAVAVILVALILVVQFNSMRQPILVMGVIPLAFIGVALGLYVTRNHFGFLPTIGTVALTGIVVNDAIVFVDYVNQLRRKGHRVREALIEGGQARLRQIILTTVTTLGGLTPLVLDIGGGAAVWRPLGISLMFGLSAATLLTLVVLPCAYSLLESDPQEPDTSPAS